MLRPMIPLDGSHLTLDQLIAIADRGAAVELAPAARDGDAAARAVVDRVADGDAPVYGINTGFGNFAETRIEHADLARLQVNLVRSHAAGVDDPLPPRAVRAMMALRANVLAKGYSGIRVDTLERLLALLNHGVHPRVPSRGSVGASGDLAPLAHLALVLIGEGQTWDGHRAEDGARALAAAGLAPVTLGPKEGIALINGTQASTAVLALALAGAEQLARAADIVAALSIDALLGSRGPFDPRIHASRAFPGQAASADNLWRLIEGSPLNESHRGCGRVQDAYSERCVPQVHGAAREALAWVRHVVTVEMNAATDNPMVFAEAGDVVSGGNFHGAPVALAADLLAMAVTQLATISERRSERLVNPTLSGLPAFLTTHGGLQSGLMMAQVTAAALASEIKTLCHPASADTIPTSANKEDHVSMSMGAALKAERALQLARHVLAVEMLCACQALDLRAPLTSTRALMGAHAAVRAVVPTLVDDRPPAPDIDAIAALISTSALEYATGMVVN
ncbi:MAG: histidine ammonia-lyase [Acidobacteria bacterium]|nr:histidine ammonia-lyase [Acidobacteriota bacterium]